MEDRYHATAIETDAHLQQCIVYIDLNVVRAGVVDHPLSWVCSGFSEGQQSPRRYRLIDLPALLALCDFAKQADFQQAHRQWVDEALQGGLAMRDALHCEVEQVDGTYALRESGEAYNRSFAVENEALRFKNALLWNTIA